MNKQLNKQIIINQILDDIKKLKTLDSELGRVCVNLTLNQSKSNNVGFLKYDL